MPRGCVRSALNLRLRNRGEVPAFLAARAHTRVTRLARPVTQALATFGTIEMENGLWWLRALSPVYIDIRPSERQHERHKDHREKAHHARQTNSLR
jgi:hypothetical protein